MPARGQEAEAKNPLGYSNALWNVVEPVRGGALMGAVEYVAIEVLVGQLVRRAMGLKMNWADSMEIHSYSLPVIGQLNFGQAFPVLQKDPKATIEIVKEATEGAKAIPGAIAGYTAHQIRQSGFKIPSYGNRDFIALMAGKILSRPVTAYLFSSLPTDFQTALLVINALFNRQKAVIDDAKERKKAAKQGEDF